MRRRAPFAVALMLPLAACAPAGTPFAAVPSASPERVASTASAPIWRSANNCAPDTPVAVWDAKGGLAGYSCIRTQPGYPIAANTPPGVLN